MNIKPICVSYNINRKFGYNATEAITIEHEEDFKTRFIDLFLYENNIKNAVDVSGATVTARMVTTPEFDSLLLNDNVSCSIGEKQGHIVVPIDKAVLPSYPCEFLVEIHIENGEDVLVLPFPLWVSMRASILDNAGVTPESQGTVPKLLKDATKALEDAEAAIENAGDYENLENKPQINGHTLSGNKTSDDLGLQKKLTAGQNITIANDGTISAEGGSQIVSGVVNQNGTITFTDSDGNTFTTTGSSVIGADGFSPVATVTPTASGATVSITDKNGTTTANISNGAPGQDYVLTEQDKSDIADIVLSELPTTEGVLYGNANN